MKLHRSLRPLVCFLLLTGMLAGCGSPDSPETTAQETIEPARATPLPTAPAETVPMATDSPETAAPPSVIDTLMAQMTLRQKVGQLFIVRPDALDTASAQAVTGLTDAMVSALADYPVGGIAMFGQNITSPGQITEFNAQLQNATAIPLFLAVDEEGGLVARLANSSAFDLPRYKNAAAVGKSGDAALALEMGGTIGAYLKEYGFNMDFAPVADVNTNPDNPVIGTRSFSSDPEIAAQMASSMAEGLRSQDIIAVYKHFPGHGDTAEDSHAGIAVSYQTAEEMAACEWLPFQSAASLDCIMVGHIAVPEITGDLTPATLSGQIVTGLLKEQLKFEGLVITDALEMGAITDSCTSGEAAVLALLAGCDILLMPENLQEAFDAVVAAVEDGRLSETWLDETVRKILQFKQNHGILPAD